MIPPGIVTARHNGEAVLQADGDATVLEPVHITEPQRVLLTFTRALDEVTDGAAASQDRLAVDWLREASEAAWAQLRTGGASA